MGQKQGKEGKPTKATSNQKPVTNTKPRANAPTSTTIFY